MSILLHQLPAQRLYSKYFTLSYMNLTHDTLIYMRMHTEIVNTIDLPQTIAILKDYIPGIFSSKCFNKKNLSFKKEAKKTEIGHLLEHIVLEYLCSAKMRVCSENVVFSGFTSWDWTKDQFGTFHITIDATIQDRALFSESLEKGILLLNLIMSSGEKSTVNKNYKFMQTESRNTLFA